MAGIKLWAPSLQEAQLPCLRLAREVLNRFRLLKEWRIKEQGLNFCFLPGFMLAMPLKSVYFSARKGFLHLDLNFGNGSQIISSWWIDVWVKILETGAGEKLALMSIYYHTVVTSRN